MGVLFETIVIAGVVLLVFIPGPVGTIFASLLIFFLLGLFLPNLAVTVRRLHDIDMSGWWILISFVPFIGGIVLLVMAVIEGTNGINSYGADPTVRMVRR